MVEGRTEKAFIPVLRSFLELRLAGRMPVLSPNIYNGRIPTGNSLKRRVNELLYGGNPWDHVIALTDVYTGSVYPYDFSDATDAKSKMQMWVGSEPRFHPHVAQYEIEAWLLPYWPRIQQLADHNQAAPGGEPERVNHGNPPSRRIQEIFSRAAAPNIRNHGTLEGFYAITTYPWLSPAVLN
jgi:hypothetical protein